MIDIEALIKFGVATFLGLLLVAVVAGRVVASLLMRQLGEFVDAAARMPDVEWFASVKLALQRIPSAEMLARIERNLAVGHEQGAILREHTLQLFQHEKALDRAVAQMDRTDTSVDQLKVAVARLEDDKPEPG